MKTMTECLKCGSSRVTKGSLLEAVFRPEGIRHLALTLTGGVSVGKEARACLDCGLVWTSVVPAKLEKFLRRHCDSPGWLFEDQPKSRLDKAK